MSQTKIAELKDRVTLDSPGGGGFKNFLQDMVMGAVQATGGHGFAGSADPPVHHLILRTGMGHHRQASAEYQVVDGRVCQIGRAHV